MCPSLSLPVTSGIRSAPPAAQAQAPAAVTPMPSSLNGFCWPTPLSSLYSKAEPWTEPQVCELEGLNGAIGRCALVALSPQDQTIQVQIERTKAPITLAFSQFRRLTLKTPIYPQDFVSAEQFPGLQSHQASAEYQLKLRDGSVRSGLTVGYVETSFGLFVFTPLDDLGAVERTFIPQDAFVSVSLGSHVKTLNAESRPVSTATGDMAQSPSAVLRTRKLDDYLADGAVVSREHLMLALDLQSKMPAVRVGEALLQLGYISKTQLEQALAEQSGKSAKPLGELLIQAGALTRRDLNTALARKMGYPVVDVARFPIEHAALEKIPLSTARRLMVLPLLTRGELTVVASANPTRREFLEELEFLLRGRVIATLGDEDQINQTITAAYDKLSLGLWPQDNIAQEAVAKDQTPGGDLLEGMELPGFGNLLPTGYAANAGSGLSDVSNLGGMIDISAISDIADVSVHQDAKPEAPPATDAGNTVLRLVNTMISEAASSGATDIHIEVPSDTAKVRIRFRKDGRLVPFLMLPHTLRAGLMARLKTMANLDTLECRSPQTGSIDVQKFSPQQPLHLRLHTIPTANGLEDVVLKLLPDATLSPALTLEQLGLSPDNLEGLRQAASLPRGMVLCVGPARSGKATTLQALLRYLGSPERKIWRAQASLNIALPEVRQVQINPHIGWTFAAALRSFLQADADILVADELPDAETAQVAIEAALTGHMLLSTLPTHSAAETVHRLIDMGLSPFSLADALQAVLAQKLVSRFCVICRTSAPASPAAIDALLDDYLAAFPEPRRPAREALLTQWTQHYGIHGALHTYQASGCSVCEGSGVAGRLGLHELMRMSPGLRRLIQTGAAPQALRHEAFEDGKFRTLRQDGISKVLAGLTSLDEVRAHTHA